MDNLSKERRSENMRRIRSTGTKPELIVRAALRELGHRGYRLHRKDLPGKPDIVFVGRKLAIQVQGCFWHRHSCKEGRRTPKSNLDYWLQKIETNVRRDRRNARELKRLGWKQLVIWECQIKNPDLVISSLKDHISG